MGEYFRWLEGDAPNGELERYPILDEKGESSVPGIYIAGDLTGIPLLKFAAEGGASLIKQIVAEQGFAREREAAASEVYELAIIGGGIAGIAAGMEAKAQGLRFTILEADRPFSTIHNFPAGKPIYTYPEELIQEAPLKTRGESKESLLDDLEAQIQGEELPIQKLDVKGISGRKGAFLIEGEGGAPIKALRVLVAIGKSGNARKLDVEGETLPHVYNRLIDPKDFVGQRVLVVGGGDSAVEAALLLAQQAKTEVTLAYRGKALTRPKAENIQQLQSLEKQGRVKLSLGTQIHKIREKEVLLQREGEKEETLPNDAVLVQIGKELPIAFFSRSKIAMENTWDLAQIWMFMALLFASGVIYFGKDAGSFSKYGLWGFVSAAPRHFLAQIFSAEWKDGAVNLAAWFSLIGLAVTGAGALGIVAKRASAYMGTGWRLFKSLYFLGIAVLVSAVYVSQAYMGQLFLGKSLGFWYTGLYSLTILIFGLRRIVVRRTRYITLQTTALIAVQVFPLFLLPEFILPWMNQAGYLPAAVKAELFPYDSFWRSYGFVLAWPLFVWNLIIGQPTTTWLVLSILQSFVLIPLLVWKWGKGAYCGWICSCGGLAETLGDEYRTTAWHGPMSRSFEHTGQVILFVAFGLTLWNLILPGLGVTTLSHLRDAYKLFVDVIMAGVLGVGVYFFLSGRFWCRFLCPLAALMHIYTRFSRYRIFSDKKKCISCGECTRHCHMGIDVMSYANKGIPMDNYECVRCSACIYVCPVQCLNFGEMKGGQGVASLLGLREEKPEHLISSETIGKQMAS